jgi:hypothetical protein
MRESRRYLRCRWIMAYALRSWTRVFDTEHERYRLKISKQVPVLMNVNANEL